MSGRRVLVVSTVVVIVLGLAFGVSRGLAYLGFPDPLDMFRPSISDVLDGRVAKADPTFRIDRMNAFAAGLEAAGVHQDASSLALRCEEGHYNLDERDGFRFHCQVEYLGYHGWSGDYAAGAQALSAAIPSECSVTREAPSTAAPLDSSPSTGALYDCPGWGTVSLRFYSTRYLSEHSEWLVGYACDGLERCKRNPDADEVGKALEGYDWYATIYVTKIYYEEPR